MEWKKLTTSFQPGAANMLSSDSRAARYHGDRSASSNAKTETTSCPSEDRSPEQDSEVDMRQTDRQTLRQKDS